MHEVGDVAHMKANQVERESLKMDSPAVTGFRQISDFSVLFDGESARISKEMPGDGLFTVREHPGVE